VGKRSSLVFDMMPSRSDFEVHPVNPVILSKGYLRGFFASAVICVYQLAQLNFYPVEFENYSTGAASRIPLWGIQPGRPDSVNLVNTSAKSPCNLFCSVNFSCAA
jgi:hypothetical protein